ncbi:MAG: hypothetical protein IKG26_07045 [Bacillus sp. (in: Bacteria)]|nr:hypothetical protein [Bacillus sp. (in: firmicutes)]
MSTYLGSSSVGHFWSATPWNYSYPAPCRTLVNTYANNPDIDYYHYGDIDAGGFYILLHLREKTGVEFKPMNMDVETIATNVDYAKPLTENDKRRLKNLLNGEFNDVVTYMLENNCKLEQEVLDL